MIFNIISGGAKFATIAATFPTGATVTCVQEPYSYTVSEGTSYDFVVPKSGVWTLTVTKNGLTETKTVDVSTYGETYPITLHIDYYLFKSGEGAKVTWTGRGNSSVPHHINSNEIYVGITQTGEITYQSYTYYTGLIDLTQYETLIVEGKASNKFSVEIRTQVPPNGTVSKSTAITRTSTGITEIPISNITGKRSITINANIGGGGYAYNVFLRA